MKAAATAHEIQGSFATQGVSIHVRPLAKPPAPTSSNQPYLPNNSTVLGSESCVG